VSAAVLLGVVVVLVVQAGGEVIGFENVLSHCTGNQKKITYLL
jgi:hypothetical protein